MACFRLVMAVFLLLIAGYTSIAITHHGWNLLPIFFGDMAAMTWPGQFNLDFFTFLLLSGCGPPGGTASAPWGSVSVSPRSSAECSFFRSTFWS
ncbi:hypothetical protein [Sphingopyxis sp. KK2]|uniref:hypothetical protein n=1 Tax=Sphingopyxis sp. KK2 TaxID=1855727 RepID=UPI0021182E66|nr:hypothetical protein [Sphingopyxis sp. KK2]